MRGVRDLVDEQGHRTRESGGCATDEESRHDETNIIVNTAQPHSQYKQAVSEVDSQLPAVFVR